MNKIVFLGSKSTGYSALNYLISNRALLKIEIIAVFSNDRQISDTNDRLIDLAKNNAIPFFNEIDKILTLPKFEILISVQYHEILQQSHINRTKKLAVNLHMAPLPEYRGCNQFSFAIIEGAKEFGATLHVLDCGIDSGDILFERRFPVQENETVQTLHQKTTKESIRLFEESIAKIILGDFTRIPQLQFNGVRKFGFHLRSEIHQIKKIDSLWPEEKIDRYIRATYFPPFPAPYTVIKGQKIDLSPNWRNEVPR